MKAYKILGTLMIALSNSMISAQAPLGASWGPTYGFPPYQAEAFMPELRRMGLLLPHNSVLESVGTEEGCATME